MNTPVGNRAPGRGCVSVDDCLPSGALDAWWLATTSRWRTTPALHRSPTKPVLCSRIREHCKAPRALRCSRRHLAIEKGRRTPTQLCGSRSLTSISYTHLTLPTSDLV